MAPILMNQLPRRELADFCRRYHIRRLSLFGPALRDDFSSAGDLHLTSYSLATNY